ncbi:HDOD domain-containing protein [Thioalkalivibrio sp. XN279]|uniref:HDOD domain-containing protein n=1 Tax=Thioalkalivibrio sp. XN279 TaxID=2714953 RepID=UPI0014088B9D|nr:HDOD domain-containing protein [Thioalkalivibrio sp. XN279]NHA15596.1 HDOD domain-containing protein [Thioalkalivibrio sp. XN279]
MELYLVVLAVGAVAALWLASRARPPRPVRFRTPTPSPAAPHASPAASDDGPEESFDDDMLPAIRAILSGEPSELDAAMLPEALAGFTLLGAADLDPVEQAQVVALVATIALPPRSAQQLISPEFTANARPREFTELVTREPLLAAKVIGRVNSAFYGLASPIVSVAHAVTYLGVNTVRNMALQCILEQAFASEDPEVQNFNAWLLDSGAIAADLTAILGPRLGIRDVGTASTQTVLTFIGDFAMPMLMSPHSVIGHWRLGLLERTQNEQFTLGANAMIVGQLLMEALELPVNVRSDVADIHRVLVTPAKEEVSEREARIALCYACARMAESIVLGRVHDSADLSVQGSHAAEFHHLQSYLAKPPLARLTDHLRAGDVKLAVARMIAGAARSRDVSYQRYHTE